MSRTGGAFGFSLFIQTPPIRRQLTPVKAVSEGISG